MDKSQIKCVESDQITQVIKFVCGSIYANFTFIRSVNLEIYLPSCTNHLVKYCYVLKAKVVSLDIY